MNFSALKTEYSGRGFNHLSDGERGSDINQARAALDEMFLWPYREKGVTGVAPVAIPDLGVVETVTNEDIDYQLAPADFRSLGGAVGDLSIAGVPMVFYVGSGNVVATYPVSSSAIIGVQYWRITPDLMDDADLPLAPSRFHPLIVDLAVSRGYRRTDNFASAQALQPWIDQQVQVMVDSLLGGQQVAGPQGYSQVNEACDT